MSVLKAGVLFGAIILCTPAGARADEVRFVKRPYLTEVGPDQVLVRFELDREAVASVSASARGQAIVEVTSAASRWHEVRLRGLSASTTYRYSVAAEGRVLSSAELSTAPIAAASSSGAVRMILWGDTRGDGSIHRRLVAKMKDEGADFLLHTGDYVHRGDREEEWQRFFDVAGPLIETLPLVAVLGNHELYSEEPGQGFARYERYLGVAAEGQKGRAYYRFDYGPVRLLVLSSFDDWREGSEQRRWLAHELEEAKGDPRVQHLFAALHHGPYSSGAHGELELLHEAGVPDLLRAGGVELVLSGHDHIYERGEADGLKYIVSGGGGAPLYERDRRAPYQHRFAAAHHFVTIDVAGPRVSMRATALDGRLLDACAYEGEGGWKCPIQPTGEDRQRASEGVNSSAMLPGLRGWMIAGGVLLAVVGAWAWRRRRADGDRS